MFLRALWNKKGKILKRTGLVLWALLTVGSTLAAGYNARLAINQGIYIEQMKQTVLEGAEASRRADQYLRMLSESSSNDPLWVALNTEVGRLDAEEVKASGIPELLVAACSEYFVKGEYAVNSSVQVQGAVFIEMIGTPQKAPDGVNLQLVLYVFVFRESDGWELYGARLQAQAEETWAQLQQTVNQ